VPVVDPGPTWGLGVVREDVLHVLGVVADGRDVGLIEREAVESPCRPPRLQ